MTEVRYYDLTKEQLEKLEKLVKELGLEYQQFGFLYHHLRNGNIIVGQISEAGLLGTILEIYYRDWPEEVKAKVDKILENLGLTNLDRNEGNDKDMEVSKVWSSFFSPRR